MLSLPTIPPRADATLWPSLRKPHQTFDSDPPSTSQSHPHRRNAHTISHGAPTRSLFTQLLVDENKQKQRNANIRHFGATWIRPPGIQKTYQAMIDEEKEIKEQETLAMREQQMMDLAAAQQDAANAEAREAAGDEIEDEERDLDDDVPEAEASGSVSEDDSDLESRSEEGSVVSGEEDESRADVTFNEDSFIEGSMIEGRVGQMLAMEEASMEGSLLEERDLDDDVPEAGDYEHTDSSLLDSSDEDDGSFVQPGSRRSVTSRRSSGAARSTQSRRSSGVRTIRRTSGMVQAHAMGPTSMMGQGRTTLARPHAMGQPRAMTQLQAREHARNSRLSIELEGSSSLMEGSSYIVSSPVAARGNVRARLFGARNQR
ncbi:hypothetical protein PMIN06_007791 [Paraphaeosphaeria minitans]|uniref:Apc15p protein-domain-containing protein n=1 Tax=Paraphaeosphaeria minitans TaxID=565426 RepID=A0A9P6GCG5_9PLEO|nr:hypothetical protein PMIN01_09754 [Paraphaeosphaeria minitans]